MENKNLSSQEQNDLFFFRTESHFLRSQKKPSELKTRKALHINGRKENRNLKPKAIAFGLFYYSSIIAGELMLSSLR